MARPAGRTRHCSTASRRRASLKALRVWNWLLPAVDVRALGGIAVAGGAVTAAVDDARGRLDAQVTIAIDEIATELLDLIVATAAGRPTASEALGHREFVLTYKSVEPAGPSCLPTLR